MSSTLHNKSQSINSDRTIHKHSSLDSQKHYNNDKVVVRNLGIIHLTTRHTGENIAVLVDQILSSYGASIRQIFAITTDNGSNMIKTTRVINEMFGNDDPANDEEMNQSNHQIDVGSEDDDEDGVSD